MLSALYWTSFIIFGLSLLGYIASSIGLGRDIATGAIPSKTEG